MKALLAGLSLLGILAMEAAAPPAFAADATALANIRANTNLPDHHDCPGCDLTGADLTNTCVKNGNLTGARFDGANAVLMCMSYANFTRATFRGTDLSGANLSHSDLTAADLSGAKMAATLIKGANLAKAKGLTQAQLDQACGDADTRLPAGLKAKTCL